MSKHFSIWFGLAALLFSAGDLCGQKPTFEQVKKVLTEGIGFTSADFETLEKGEIVIKKLEVEAEGEVAFSGVLKLNAPRDVVFDAFRRAVERQQREISTEYGNFKNPPEIGDLQKLTVKDSEIRSLKNCKPGDCSWSLSNDLINRFTAGIDWSAPKSEEKASELIKQIMVEHLQGYLKNGDQALMVYNDDPEPLSLADEQKSLLGRLLWINDFAPEFNTYLKNFPNGKLDGIEDLSSWAKVRVALKPVIINTHTIFYKKPGEGVPQGLIISKQIYANHYFHSSLSLTGIISFPNSDGTFSTYVFFVSHSRAGALTGTMGQLARGAVDGEAETKLADVLKDTKRYTGYALGAEEGSLEEKSGIVQRIFGNKLVLIAILLAAVGLIVWLVRRRSKASSTSSSK